MWRNILRKLRTILVALAVMLALAACGGYESESGLSPDDERQLIELGRLKEGERVLFYTSRGRDIEDAGAFFTETRVVAYWVAKDEDEAEENTSIDFKDITRMKAKIFEDSWTRADYVTVTWGPDGKKVRVYLQCEGENFPEHFYEAMKKQWEKVKAAG